MTDRIVAGTAVSGGRPAVHANGKEGFRALHGWLRERGGRCGPRDVTSMAAMTAVCWNPAMREMYERLTAAGRAHRVAPVAVMRQPLILTNVLPRDGRGWSPDAPVPAPS